MSNLYSEKVFAMASKGLIYKLLIEDDRSDDIIMATALLRRRLAEMKKSAGVAAIEATHRLLIAKTSKPFVNVTSEYYRAKAAMAQGTLQPTTQTKLTFELPHYNHFTSDMALRLIFEPLDGRASSTYYRYCSYPGARIQNRVAFTSEGKVIASYTRENYVHFLKKTMTAANTIGYQRLLGQQEVKHGKYFNPNGYTQITEYSDGPQTLKLYQPALEMIIPLDLWPCAKPENIIVNTQSAETSRKIEIDLEKATDIVKAYTIETSGSGNDTEYKQTEISLNATVKFTAELYVNNIATLPEVYSIIAERAAEPKLIRVHCAQTAKLNSTSTDVKLTGVRFAVEGLTISVRDPANTLNPDNWWLDGRAVARTNATSMWAIAGVHDGDGTIMAIEPQVTELDTYSPLATSASLKVRDIEICRAESDLFYNSYLINRYPELAARAAAPVDRATMLMTFGQLVGSADPTGVLNLSAERDVYLNITGAGITSSTPAELSVTAQALNFIVQYGDVIVLKNIV